MNCKRKGYLPGLRQRTLELTVVFFLTYLNTLITIIIIIIIIIIALYDG
jgi:hypothetical protein